MEDTMTGLSEQADRAESVLVDIIGTIQALAREAEEIEAEIAARYGSRELDARLRDINDDLDYWCAYAEDAYEDACAARAAADGAVKEKRHGSGRLTAPGC